MAKKPDPPEQPKRGRPKSATRKPVVPVVMTIRAGADWETWLDRAGEALVKQSGLPIKMDRTEVVDASLRTLAEKLNLPMPPARY